MARAAKQTTTPLVLTGLAFEVPGDELVARVTQRIAWHERHAKEADVQLRRLRAADEGRVDLHAESIRRDAGKRLRDHEQRASFLAFVRDHVVQKAIYRLTPTDLKVLDIMSETHSLY